MKITFEQYISNPSQSSLFTSTMREAMKTDFSNRFGKIMIREHSDIKYKLFKDSKKNKYYIYIKIPSEVIRNFYYDTIIEFYADSDVKESGTNISKYYVRFFSNDPSFVFTYAHTFMNKDIFIKELLTKLPKEVIKGQAKVKNPTDTIGYVKSIYFSYLLMKNKGLFNQSRLDAESTEIDFNSLLAQVENADSKIQARQSEGENLNKHKRNQKKKETIIGGLNKNNNLKMTAVRTVKTSKRTGSVTKTVRSTKITKRK